MMNYSTPILFFTFFLVYFSANLSAQTKSLQIDKLVFQTDLDGKPIDETCYRLTPNRKNAIGRVWCPETFNIYGDFYIDLNIFMGCSDQKGADGLLFIFNQKPVYGIGGAPMGRPSLGIEIDTYQNTDVNDPVYDHLAVLKNNQFDHNKSSFNLIQLPNMEDCRYHPMKIKWQANIQQLSITLDDKEVYKDKVNLEHIFKNNPIIYFGIAASTVRGGNEQKVCFEKITYQEIIAPTSTLPSFSKAIEQKLLKGQILSLDNISFDNTDLEKEEAEDLEKLVSLLQQHPNVHIDVFAHVHRTNQSQSNMGLSVIRANEVKKALVQLGIDSNRIQAKGMGGKFPRNKREVAKGKPHERIEVYVYKPLP